MANKFSNRQLLSKSFNLKFVIAISLIFSVIQTPFSLAATPPSAPQYVEAMADSTQAAITWEAPNSNGGETTLNYTARVWTVPPPTASPVFATCTTTQFGCIVTGLTSGTPYYVDVIASNSAGAGAPSAVKPMTPGGAAKAPSNVSATSDSKGLVTIKWTPITNAGTGVFSWYTAEVFTSPEISIGAYSGYCTESNISASSCFIGGLKLGATYYAQVRVYSSLGSGYPSTPRFKIVAGTPVVPSASPTPSKADPTPIASPKVTSSPSQKSSSKATPIFTRYQAGSTPVRSLRVVALSKGLEVSWSPPEPIEGSKIYGYRVEITGASSHVVQTSAKSRYCRFFDLLPEQLYQVVVYTIYKTKDGRPSKAVKIYTKR